MNEMSFAELGPLLPELFLSLAGMALLVIGVLRKNQNARFLSGGVLIAFAIAIMLLLGLDWERVTVMNGMFVMDSFAGMMKLLILGGMVAVLALSVRYLEQEQIDRFEYPVLLVFATIGMMIMVSANNFMSLYVGLELQSFCLYILAAFNRDHVKSAESGLKYFILGALASGMMLFGISLIYGFTGSVSFPAISTTLADPSVAGNMGVIIGLVFVLAGLAFKLSAVPFHMWTPDVYEGAPTSVTTLLAVVPKVAAIGLLMRVLFEPFGNVVWQWQQIIWFLSVASMVWAAFAAMAQNNIKRLMAYSSIGHMGYALIGLAAASKAGAGAVVVYMMIYMIMTAGAFGIILMMRRDGAAAEKISDLSGLSQNSPFLAYGLAILLFSMAGIPPLAGFLGKFLIFEAAVAEGMYVLAVIGVLSSVVAAYYYIRVIKVMFFDEAADPFDKKTAFMKRTVVLVSVLFVLGFIAFPSGLISAGQSAVNILFTSQ